MNNIINKEKGIQIKNAATFNHNAHNLVSAVIKKEQNSEDILSMLIPDIMLCAFTCELYLKSILVKNEIPFGRTHELDKLFYILDQETQALIEKETIKELKCFDPDCEYNFREILINNGNAFIEVRYFYENGFSINYSFLVAFTNALGRVSRQVYR